MSPEFGLGLGLILGSVGWFVRDFVARRGERQARRAEASVRGTSEHVAHLAAIKALPEPSWSERFDPRSRLRSVPLTPSARIAAEPLTEAEWLDLLSEPYDYKRGGL